MGAKATKDREDMHENNTRHPHERKRSERIAQIQRKHVLYRSSDFLVGASNTILSFSSVLSWPGAPTVFKGEDENVLEPDVFLLLPPLAEGDRELSESTTISLAPAGLVLVSFSSVAEGRALGEGGGGERVAISGRRGFLFESVEEVGNAEGGLRPDEGEGEWECLLLLGEVVLPEVWICCGAAEGGAEWSGGGVGEADDAAERKCIVDGAREAMWMGVRRRAACGGDGERCWPGAALRMIEFESWRCG